MIIIQSKITAAFILNGVQRTQTFSKSASDRFLLACATHFSESVCRERKDVTCAGQHRHTEQCWLQSQ